ncbi:MAG: single-stranded DNA-binding protein [Candidatus Paceibacterota bacterium]
MNLNKVFIIGNLTRDPELKTLPSGTAVASFGVATNRVWKDQSGQKKEDVQFHNIVVFGRQAETVSQYLTKGSSVLVEGRIQTRNWDAQDGSKKSKTEIVAERVQFGPRRGAGTGTGAGGGSGTAGKSAPAKEEELATIEYPEEEINPEEIPF